MDASFSNALFAPRYDEDGDNGSQMRHQPLSSGPSSSSAQSQQPKKRKYQISNLDDVEIIALSPTSLMAKNRYVCEVCDKGFQREQNLQLHRRGHNLPWKLKQKGPKEVMKRKLYLCPEVTCPHHDPSRALGDLTGVKKHFSRKHGEKNFKCDKCDKKYAVLSDCKAHTKSCGTRDYRCDCGTIFSRRDSFITHRSFCDALLKQQGAMLRPSSSLIPTGTTLPQLGLSRMASPHHDMLRLGHSPLFPMSPSFQSAPSMRTNTLMSPSFQYGPNMRQDTLIGSSFQSSPGLRMQFPQTIFLQPQVPNHVEENQVPLGFQLPPRQSSAAPFDHGLMQITDQIHFDSNNSGADISDFASLLDFSLFPGTGTNNTSAMDSHQSGFGEDFNLFSSAVPSLYSTSAQAIHSTGTAQMSATALLQKAGQFGSTYSTNQGAATDPPREFFENYQPEGLNDDNFEGFGDNITSQLYDLTNVTSGSSSSVFGGDFNDNVQDMDQYFGDRWNDNLAPFGGEGIGFGSLEPDEGMTRDFLGIGPLMEDTNDGDVDVRTFDDSETGNTNTLSQRQDFGGPDFNDFEGLDFDAFGGPNSE